MKLIITRHGETEENVLGIIMGHLPGKLTKKGIEQAKKLALRLKDEKIDYIYSSDLARSSDTTKKILKYHPNVNVKYTKELRERFLGNWQGKTHKEVGFKKTKIIDEFCSDDGECNKELFNRAKLFLQKIFKKHKNKTVLFVGHNGINKAIISVILGKTYKELEHLENLHNTSISIFDINEKKNNKVHVFNCTKHLD
jgi:probable phosphoglycerate mutase